MHISSILQDREEEEEMEEGREEGVIDAPETF